MWIWAIWRHLDRVVYAIICVAASAPVAAGETGYKDWVFLNYTFKRFEGLTHRNHNTLDHNARFTHRRTISDGITGTSDHHHVNWFISCVFSFSSVFVQVFWKCNPGLDFPVALDYKWQYSCLLYWNLPVKRQCRSGSNKSGYCWKSNRSIPPLCIQVSLVSSSFQILEHGPF